MDEDSKRWLWWAIPVVVVVGLGAALYYGRRQKEPEPEQVAPEPVAEISEPAIRHPLESAAPPPAQPLPSLDASDAQVQESLAGVFGRSLDEYLVPRSIIRNVVVTVDNLPRRKTAVDRWPVKPTSGGFLVSGGDEIVLSEDNDARYAPLVKIVQGADTQQVAALYKRFYPLFQEAYVGLGYPDAYFNDRLVEVIDHLLATPDVQGPIRLTQPGVFYEFADRALEERSAGQKTLIRMGSGNAAAIKSKLRELRQEIARQ